MGVVDIAIISKLQDDLREQEPDRVSLIYYMIGSELTELTLLFFRLGPRYL